MKALNVLLSAVHHLKTKVPEESVPYSDLQLHGNNYAHHICIYVRMYGVCMYTAA